MSLWTSGHNGGARDPGPGRVGRLASLSLVLVFALSGCRRDTPKVAPTGEQLKVEIGKAAKLDPDAALRCFVHGQFVGMQTPSQCALKNGIAPGALDVGLDQSGALAAGGDTPLQPLSNAEADNSLDDANQVGDSDDDQSPTPSPQAGLSPPPSGLSPRAIAARVNDCLRFTRAGWRSAAQGVGLNACVHLVFDAQCLPAGQVIYGRWGEETLRLLPGRLDMSSDNRVFHPLLRQNPQDCSLPQL